MSKPESETARRALAIAAALAAADPGDKAEARRMGPAGCALFWRQVARLGITPAQETDWLLFTRLVAHMTPASRDQTIHEAQRHLGAVLADGGERTRALNAASASGSARISAALRPETTKPAMAASGMMMAGTSSHGAMRR